MRLTSGIAKDSQILPTNQWISEWLMKKENTVLRPLQLIGVLFSRTESWLNNESVIKFVACAKIRQGWVACSNVLIRDRVSTSWYAWIEQLFSAAIEMNYQMPSEKFCSESSFIRKDLFTALQKPAGSNVYIGLHYSCQQSTLAALSHT